MVRRITVIALLLMLSVSALFAQVTAVPSALNFQGRLATPSGNPVPNGTYSILFSLYDALTGGTLKYSKTVASVQVRNGTFAVTLDTFPAGTFNGTLYLEIKIGADTALTPRQPLVTVPYAFKAGSVVDGSVTGASIANGSLTASNFPANFFNSTAWLLGGNSATNPATQFLGTTDNQPLVFRTNNVEKMRVLPDGTIGINTTSPIAPVNLNTPSGGYGFVQTAGAISIGTYAGAGAGWFGTRSNHPLYFFVNDGSASMLITNGGTYPIILGRNTEVQGTLYAHTTGDALLGSSASGYGVWGTSSTSAGVRGLSTSGDGVYASTFGDGSHAGVYGTSNTSGGNGIIGLCNGASSSYGVWGQSDVGYGLYSTGSAGGTTFWFQSSDARYKTHIASLDNPLGALMQLRGVTYEWNRELFRDRNFPAGRQLGLIAQEVERVFPPLVREDREGYKAVAYSGLVPVLVEAVKTLKKDNDALKAKNDVLEARLTAIENALALHR